MLTLYSHGLEKFSHGFAKWTGTDTGFTVAIVFICCWLLAGKLNEYSPTWQLVFYICMSLVTFLMIFLMQRSQNKELLAIHIKLNELIAVTRQADNRLINIEEHSEKDIIEVHNTHREIVHRIVK